MASRSGTSFHMPTRESASRSKVAKVCARKNAFRHAWPGCAATDPPSLRPTAAPTSWPSHRRHAPRPPAVGRCRRARNGAEHHRTWQHKECARKSHNSRSMLLPSALLCPCCQVRVQMWGEARPLHIKGGGVCGGCCANKAVVGEWWFPFVDLKPLPDARNPVHVRTGASIEP